MGGYNWPKIVSTYSNSQLTKIVNDSRIEDDQKVEACINELKKRGFDTNNLELAIDGIDKIEEVKIDDVKVCQYCKSKGLPENDKYCPVCGFPQGGTQLERKKFILNINKKKQLLEKNKKAIVKARYVLFGLAILNLIIGLAMGLNQGQSGNIILLSGIFGSVIYSLLGFWSIKQPFSAILSGLLVYIVFSILAIIEDPNALKGGWLWRALIIGAFIYGYQGVMESKKIEKELSVRDDPKDLTSEN